MSDQPVIERKTSTPETPSQRIFNRILLLSFNDYKASLVTKAPTKVPLVTTAPTEVQPTRLLQP